MAEMLDQLMGSERDVPLEERKNLTRTWRDRDVCKHYLCGFDVHLFKNTRSEGDVLRHIPPQDLGKLQDDELKAQWEALDDAEKARAGYERDLKRILDNLVRDCDARVRRVQERCDAENERANAPPQIPPEERAILDGYAAQIKSLAEEAEALGEAGDVDGAQAAVAKSESLEKLRAAMEARLAPPKTRAPKTSHACPVSAVLLTSADSESRRAEHVTGKQYVGWKRVRELRDELEARLAKYDEASASRGRGPSPRSADARRPDRRDDRRDDRRRWDDRRVDRRWGGRDERDRSRDRRRSRSRSRSRSRERERSRDGGRDRRDRDGGWRRRDDRDRWEDRRGDERRRDWSRDRRDGRRY